MTQPQPGQLDHDGAGLGITGFADALIAADGTALEMARRQSDIAPKLLAIVEMPRRFKSEVQQGSIDGMAE